MLFKTKNIASIILVLVLLVAFSCSKNKKVSIKTSPVIQDTFGLSYAYFDKGFSDSIISSCQAQTKDLQKYFDRLHKSGGFNGNILIARKGVPIFSKSYGYRRFSTKDSLRIDDPFQLASVSKTITSTAVLQLYNQGLIKLTDTIQQYIPEFPKKYQGITIDDLLCHHSGLFEYWHFNDKEWRKGSHFLTFKKLMDKIIEIEPSVNFYPNRRFKYNNLNYVLLAHIVEKVSGQSFEDYLQENIFKKANMTTAFVFDANDSTTIQKRLAYGHYSGRKEYILDYPDGIYGDKGIYASVIDMLNFDQALYHEALISKETMELAFANKPIKNRRTRRKYGYGWRIDEDELGNRVVYHNGWWKGYKTKFARVGDNEWTVVVLSNRLRANRFTYKNILKLLYK
ncbi:beta-lactamase family protein [Cyclobacteriaceae bacterium]|nr:beta-lactamase family protein [Cyclobacteriaceae bacterium]